MKTPFILALTLLQLASANADTDATAKKGWAGQLSSLDGGLGGTVTVVEADQLLINDYKLEDASAPALYWWGSATSNLGDGFRISTKQVDEAASSNTYTIDLDAGKTTADFSTVGLWCERFSANFGQATLAPANGSGAPSSDAGSGGTGSGGSSSTGGDGMRSAGAGRGVPLAVIGVGAGAVTLFLL
ncbi:hypothetical protein OQA88_10969 [Cercophora sp. LCS_1]